MLLWTAMSCQSSVMSMFFFSFFLLSFVCDRCAKRLNYVYMHIFYIIVDNVCAFSINYNLCSFSLYVGYISELNCSLLFTISLSLFMIRSPIFPCTLTFVHTCGQLFIWHHLLRYKHIFAIYFGLDMCVCNVVHSCILFFLSPVFFNAAFVVTAVRTNY